MNIITKAKDFLGKEVEVTMDRPLGSKHPKHGFVYESNYGFIEGTKSPDGEELDAYYLGVNIPLKKEKGVCVAIIHRTDDDDDKLIVVPIGTKISDEEIEEQTKFQEQWFKHEIMKIEEKTKYMELLNVSKEVGLPVKKIVDMFTILLSSESIDNTELLRNLGVSRNVLNHVKEKLSKYFTPSSTTTSLSDIGKKEIAEMELDKSVEEDLVKLDSLEIAKIEKVLEKHKSKQPEPERRFDQFIATRETVAKRAILMKFLGDVIGKRILFLGDDDFTSVAISELRSAAKVQVVDIDERILNGIKDASKEEGYNIEIGIADFRKEISEEYRGKFDVVFTDPPYTPEGITLFLSRAIEALDTNNQAARIYFCYGNSDRAKERFLPVYEAIYKSGLMLRYVFDKFNRYRGAESIGSSSTLFVCEITPKTKSLVRGDSNAEIYTNN